MSKTLSKDEFGKQLQKLEALAKAQVEKVEKAQLFHPAQDSDQLGFAGSEWFKEDAFSDEIEPNGTDYNGVKSHLAEKAQKGLKLSPAELALSKGQNPFKHIAQKVEKGLSLTKAESWCLAVGAKALKSMILKGESSPAQMAPETHAGDEDNEHEAEPAHKAMPMDMDDDKDEDDKEDKEEKAYKSFNGIAKDSEHMVKGIELSPFLAEMVSAINTALQAHESRVSKAVTSLKGELDSLQKSFISTQSDDVEYKKALAEAVTGIAHQVNGVSELAVASARQPARGPKSAVRDPNQGGSVIQKSFEGQNEAPTALQKSQIMDAMVDLVVKGKMSQLDALSYEHTGQMSDGTKNLVLNHLQSGLK